MDQKIVFKYGLQSEYDSLGSGRSADILFFVTDSQRLYRGDLLMATGKDVSSVASGLMGPEQLALLNELAAEMPKKVDKQLVGPNGISTILQERDGGGAHFSHNDGSESYVGVNDGGKDGMMAQIYADVKEDGSWVGSRINVYHNGIYYVSKENQKAGFAKNAAEMEIATKKDIADLGKVLRFRGVFNSLDEVTDPQHGDVAIVAAKEYIYVVSGGIAEWKEFGDVAEYATKEELTAAKVELGQRIDKKVDGELQGIAGKSLMFNEKDGGGSKFEGANNVVAYVGTHDNIGGEIGTQIYVDKANGTESTIIDVTQNGAYYTKGTIVPGAQRDIAENEIATKKDVADGAPKWEPIA